MGAVERQAWVPVPSRVITLSSSDIVNDAVRAALAEDQEDLSAFDERADESTMSYEELLNDLKANGKI